MAQQVVGAATTHARGLFNAVGDFGNSLREGVQRFGNWAAREAATQLGFSLALGAAGPVASGQRGASPALRSIFAEGGLAGKSIIGIRSKLMEGGFKMTLSKNKQGYLFEAGGEQVRIMRRGGGWEARVRNQAGNYLDEMGNVAPGAVSSHGIRVRSR